MNEGMTPMQRALAKVKAQSKDKESVELDDLENVNEAFGGFAVAISSRKATRDEWYVSVSRTMKKLEDDLKDRKKMLGYAKTDFEKDEAEAIIKGHINPSLKAIDDFRNKLAGVAKAYDKAFYDASNVDSAIRHADAAMRAYDRKKR